jgi:dipeptidyl aminopeptidase/acylaminoacyl peptidase
MAVLFNEGGDATGGTPRAFFRKTDGSQAVRIGDGAALALSPDAARALVRDGNGLALVPVGAGAAQPLALGPIEEVRDASFFPDGKKILLYGVEKGKGTRFWTVEPPAEPVPASPVDTQGGAKFLSPDGQRVIVWSADTSVLSIMPLGGGPTVPVRGTEHDDPLAWTPDGRGLYVRPGGGGGGRIEILDVATLARTPWKTLAPPDSASVSEITAISFARDGSAYAYTYRRVLTSDLYVVEGLR